MTCVYTSWHDIAGVRTPREFLTGWGERKRAKFACATALAAHSVRGSSHKLQMAVAMMLSITDAGVGRGNSPQTRQPAQMQHSPSLEGGAMQRRNVYCLCLSIRLYILSLCQCAKTIVAAHSSTFAPCSALQLFISLLSCPPPLLLLFVLLRPPACVHEHPVVRCWGVAAVPLQQVSLVCASLRVPLLPLLVR